MKNYQDSDMKKIQDIPYQQVYSNGEDYVLRTFSDEMNGGYGWHEFPLRKEDYEVYKNGVRDAGELTFKAVYGVWPPTKEEQDRVKKERAEKRPIVLISNPKNQRLFSQNELEKLIPLAEQQWIDWKGQLPDNYISPLKQSVRCERNIIQQISRIDHLFRWYTLRIGAMAEHDLQEFRQIGVNIEQTDAEASQ